MAALRFAARRLSGQRLQASVAVVEEAQRRLLPRLFHDRSRSTSSAAGYEPPTSNGCSQGASVDEPRRLARRLWEIHNRTEELYNLTAEVEKKYSIPSPDRVWGDVPVVALQPREPASFSFARNIVRHCRELRAQQKRADARDARADARDARADARDVRADARDVRADARDARADACDARADALDARADALDTRADALDARADALDARADAWDKKLEQQQDPNSFLWRLFEKADQSLTGLSVDEPRRLASRLREIHDRTEELYNLTAEVEKKYSVPGKEGRQIRWLRYDLSVLVDPRPNDHEWRWLRGTKRLSEYGANVLSMVAAYFIGDMLAHSVTKSHPKEMRGMEKKTMEQSKSREDNILSD